MKRNRQARNGLHGGLQLHGKYVRLSDSSFDAMHHASTSVSKRGENPTAVFRAASSQYAECKADDRITKYLIC